MIAHRNSLTTTLFAVIVLIVHSDPVISCDKSGSEENSPNLPQFDRPSLAACRIWNPLVNHG